MKSTIGFLAQTLKDTEESEPEYRAQGNHEQADIRSSVAAELRMAIAILSAVERGPIWPTPAD